MRAGSIALVALVACAGPRPPAHGPVAFERHPLYVAMIPFGAGQVQNGERGKALAFAATEGVTAAASVGAWLYLRDRYPDDRVPRAASRSSRSAPASRSSASPRGA